MIRVLLVDDQPLARAGLSRILSLSGGIVVVGECQDGDQVLDAVERYRPDVVMMDMRMPRMDGAQATGILMQRPESPPVLVLTTFDDDETLAAALGAGAAGFVLKDAPGEDIVRATRAVARGDSWIDPQVAGRVLRRYRQTVTSDGGDRLAALDLLTPREVDVLRCVGGGSTNGEIADELCISEATVKSHLGRLLVKLGLRDRVAAIVFAHRHGIP